MLTVSLRGGGSKGAPSAIALPAGSTAGDLRKAVAERDGVSAASLRLIFRAGLLGDDVALGAVASSERAPVHVVIRPPPAAGGAQAGEEVLIEMPFEQALVRQALQLCRGDLPAATRLLLSGDVSEAGLQQLQKADRVAVRLRDVPPQQQQRLLAHVRQDQRAMAVLQRGDEVALEGRGMTIVIARDDLGGRGYGGPPPPAGGSGACAGGCRALPPTGAEAEADAEFTAEEQQQIQQLLREGFDPDLVVQVYVACDKNVESARALLPSLAT
jgi:hypothetical protein